MEQNKEERTLQEMLQTLDEQIRQLESEDISLEDSFLVYARSSRMQYSSIA